MVSVPLSFAGESEACPSNSKSRCSTDDLVASLNAIACDIEQPDPRWSTIGSEDQAFDFLRSEIQEVKTQEFVKWLKCQKFGVHVAKARVGECANCELVIAADFDRTKLSPFPATWFKKRLGGDRWQFFIIGVNHDGLIEAIYVRSTL
jgi:hypothetical protein